MTAMPQLVSLFNAVGGGAAALIAIEDYLRLSSAGGDRPARHEHLHRPRHHHRLDHVHRLADRVGQAPGPDPGKPIMIPGGRLVTAALALITVVAAVVLFATGTPNVGRSCS